MLRVFEIAGRKIGEGHPCFIVAEMSGNHNQDINRAYKLIDAAADAGVDAVKLQTYTPDTLTLNVPRDNPNIKYFLIGKSNTWAGQTLYELYKTAYTPWEWQPALKKYGEERGLIVFSTPFDETAVDFLEQIDVYLYKVASFEVGDVELLARIGKTKKPVVLSRGLASISEVQQAIDVLTTNGTPQIAVLHCVSSYPALPAQMNLSHIPDIRKRFGVIAGLSDHSLGIEAAQYSVGYLQAAIIEKHFTLNRADRGPDATFSLEPDELKQLVQTIRTIEANGFHPTETDGQNFHIMEGTATYTPDKLEQENIVFKRSLIVTADIKAGELFTSKNIGSKRPGYGLNPNRKPEILGKRASQNIIFATPLSEELISP